MKCYHCPVRDFSCPYFVEEDQGLWDICTIENPSEDCEVFFEYEVEDFCEEV